jgi:hypothetical protein
MQKFLGVVDVLKAVVVEDMRSGQLAAYIFGDGAMVLPFVVLQPKPAVLYSQQLPTPEASH